MSQRPNHLPDLVMLWLTLLIAAFLSPGEALGQSHETFDSATTTWQRKESDCIVNDGLWKQTRANEVEQRNRYEKLAFACGPGTKLLVAHDVPPAMLIPELIPSVRIKASRPGIQLLVRVVLPHVPAPDGSGPMTTTLLGPTYQQTGKWELLSCKDQSPDLRQRLKQEVWLLRRKYGSHVTDRDAYIDKVVLNLYAGAGKTIVQIDDLKLDGIIGADHVASQIQTFGKINTRPTIQLAQFNQASSKQPSLVVRDGTVLLVRKQPFFARIIQHNGEPFDFLAALGFNTIQLKGTATGDQLAEAQRLGIWLVCPPPTSIGLSPITFDYDRVLAWSLGEKLTGRSIETIQQRVREIRESDQREGRPVVVNANSHWDQISRHADIMSIGLEPLGTSFIASRYSDWIAQRSQSIANSKPVWVDVQTELPEVLLDQVSAIATQVPPTPIEAQQIKFLVYEALAGGARGLRFTSRSRLDATDPVTHLRAITLDWINAHVDQLEPWAVGGVVMGELPLKNNGLEVTALQTGRARLLLVQRPTHHEQFWAGDVLPATISFRDPASTFTDRAYQLAETGLQPLSHNRSHEGNEIRIENCPCSTAIVLTQDPLVVNQLTQSYERVSQESLFDLHIELARQWLAIMQLIDSQMTLMGHGSPAANSSLNKAINAFRTVDSMVVKNSPQTASRFLDQADAQLATVRGAFMSAPLGSFQSKTSTPFVSHCSLIPLHWELALRLSESEWNPNGLAGGDFENLNHMLSAGWENYRVDDERFSTNVELAESAMVDGRYGCRLTVAAQPGTSFGLIEATPLWIASPELPVKGSQLVRIHGWVNVPNTILGNHDGLTITDSLTGPEMMERIPITDGWQEFTLYRAAEVDGTVKVTFALTGIGEALLDEVTIRTVDLTPVNRQAKRAAP